MTKIFRKNFKSAFTLAEVLITLVIIGVIAAATIPTLLQKHFEQEMITKLKKNMSVFNNAIVQAVRENGNITEWELGESDGTQEGSRLIFNNLKPYLKIQKDCGFSGSGNCFASSYKALIGNTQSNWSDINKALDYYKFGLDDGTAFAIWNFRKGCPVAHGRSRCATVFIDLNGPKGPNRMGHDLFLFTFSDASMFPFGLGVSNLKDNNFECSREHTDNKKNGSTCGTHAFYKGNMDYLRRDISDEWQ